MIKRSFISLARPRLKYSAVEQNPKELKSIPIPTNLTLLIDEALDNVRKAQIQKGDTVEKGQVLRLYDDSDAYAVSPSDGTINALDTFINAQGKTGTYIVIKTQPQAGDNKGKTCTLKEEIASADQFLRTLPGAPPFKALAGEGINIKTVVITCTDADLLTTTRQFIGKTQADQISVGAKIIKNITGAAKVCATVAPGSNLQGSLSDIQVFTVDPTYPAGLPALVMKKHLGIVLPAGSTPEEMGVCFISAEAAVCVAKAYNDQAANYQKVVTVIGKQGTAYQASATIGTPIKKILDQFSIQVNDQDRLILGGPMTGTSTFTIFHPVEPDTDTVIVQDLQSIEEINDAACVNCGKCVRTCPANIPVNILVRYLAADEYEDAADKCDLESCIECGLCSYVCTARIPVYQYIKLGKNELSKLKAEEA